MNRQEMLLSQLAEECGELIQCVGKIHRFGIDDTHPETGKSNKEELHKGMVDVMALVEMVRVEIDGKFEDVVDYILFAEETTGKISYRFIGISAH